MNVEDLIALLEDFRKHDPQAKVMVMAKEIQIPMLKVTGAYHEIADPDISNTGTVWLQAEEY